MSLHEDFANWEAGHLSREELIASYASSDKNGAEPWEKNLEKNVNKNAVERTLTQMLDLHERLTDLGNEPVPYHESDWVQLRESLPDRIQHRRVFGGGRLARPLIAASMVVGLTAGAAAASPTVREHMVSVWHGIQHIVAPGDPRTGGGQTPAITSPDGPGDHVNGGPVGTTGNSGNPGGGNSGNPGGGNSGNPGGGNSGNPGGGNSGNPGGGNSGNPGGTGTPGGSGDPGNGNGNGNADPDRLATQ
jgi:hypothetical protein